MTYIVFGHLISSSTSTHNFQHTHTNWRAHVLFIFDHVTRIKGGTVGSAARDDKLSLTSRPLKREKRINNNAKRFLKTTVQCPNECPIFKSVFIVKTYPECSNEI